MNEMHNKALDFRFMLFEYYKDLRINETELVVLLFIEHLQNKETEFITPDLINLQSNIDIKIIDEVMVKLVSKGLIEFTMKNGKMITSLNPLRSKLQTFFALNYEQKKQNNNEEIHSQMDEIYHLIQNGFGRSLSPVEIQTIDQWFTYGYSLAMIKEAYEEAMKKKRFNIRAIDKALLKLATVVDFAIEGRSVQDAANRKSIGETLADISEKINDDDQK